MFWFGCCLAGIFAGIDKAAQAGELPPNSSERCAQRPPRAKNMDAPNCEHVGGHVRVNLGSDLPYPPGSAGNSAMPVRLGDGGPMQTRLQIPANDLNIPIPR